MEISIARRVVIFSILALMLAPGALPAPSRASKLPPWVLCFAASNSDQLALEHSLSPANGAEVPAGTAITFSGESPYPVTFSIASAPALLSAPDIDSGAGSAGPGQTSSFAAYTFTSTKAAEVPRTIYWQASFSNAGIPECAEKPSTVSTEARTLTVLPPVPAPPVARSETHPTTAPASPLRVSIRKPVRFSVRHPRITFGVRCTSACTGHASYEVFVPRPHARPREVSKLELRSRSVHMRASGGGEARLLLAYRGSALQTLKDLLLSGGTVEVRFFATVKGQSGEVATARRVLRWHV